MTESTKGEPRLSVLLTTPIPLFLTRAERQHWYETHGLSEEEFQAFLAGMRLAEAPPRKFEASGIAVSSFVPPPVRA